MDPDQHLEDGSSTWSLHPLTLGVLKAQNGAVEGVDAHNRDAEAQNGALEGLTL